MDTKVMLQAALMLPSSNGAKAWLIECVEEIERLAMENEIRRKALMKVKQSARDWNRDEGWFKISAMAFDDACTAIDAKVQPEVTSGGSPYDDFDPDAEVTGGQGDF